MPRRSHTGSQRILQARQHLSRGFHPRKFGRLAPTGGHATPHPGVRAAAADHLSLLPRAAHVRAHRGVGRLEPDAAWDRRP
eukprot:scaffold9706_cov69-Phaeocystis_antarctica.AAC.2